MILGSEKQAELLDVWDAQNRNKKVTLLGTKSILHREESERLGANNRPNNLDDSVNSVLNTSCLRLS